MAKWKSLPTSLMGRVGTIKMIVLPKINSLFSVILSKPSPDWFRSLDSSKFLWKDKPRLSAYKHYRGPKRTSSQHYFWANRLQFISDEWWWFFSPHWGITADFSPPTSSPLQWRQQEIFLFLQIQAESEMFFKEPLLLWVHVRVCNFTWVKRLNQYFFNS